MATVDAFVQSPSEELLNSYTKEQLLKLVEHYDVDVGDKRLKDEIKGALKAALVKKGVLPGKMQTLGAEVDQSVVSTAVALSFEQQKELLLLQMERDKLSIEKERVRHSLEKEKMELEQYRLDLIKAGKLSGGVEAKESSPQGVETFDVVRNLRLVPTFDEKEPDAFFSLFERVAELRGWPEADCVIMLQSVLTGKAQEAYSALSASDCQSFATVKDAVLKAYELVPEAYRQRFRSWRKSDKQSHLEFARDLTKHFNRWCSALGVSTFQDLCELMVLEQFKDRVPPEVATYIAEREVKTVSDAAKLADEYVLAHKGQFGKNTFSVGAPARVLGQTKFMSSDPAKGYGGVKPSKLGQACNYCHGDGHWKAECPLLRSKLARTGKQVKPVALTIPAREISVVSQDMPVLTKSDSESYSGFEDFVSDGFVSLPGDVHKVPVKILRDTGAKDSFILASVLPFSQVTDTGECVLVQGMGLTTICAPLHKVRLSCSFVDDDICIGVRPALPLEGVHVILGNDLAGNRVWADSSLPVKSRVLNESHECEQGFSDFVACAVTRAAAKRDTEPVTQAEECQVEPDFIIPQHLSVSQQELVQAQHADASLAELFRQVQPSVDARSAASGYFLHEDVLVRKWSPQGLDCVGRPVVQIVVPIKYRDEVLKCSHDKSGHLGVTKTYNYILRYFFWPRLKRDVSAYVKTCHICQVVGKPNQSIKPAPLCPIPAVSNPFEYLIIDCVGPLPRSKSGSEYLLTVMCQVTRYPAAYPLRTITAKSVVKALTQFISIFGIPKIIQSDQGSNFSSNLFAQVLKLLNITHNKASPYHPQSQGALERFHQTLKSLLRAYCTEMRSDWEEGLPWLLLAAREVCQESTGFSPNDLVFGHKVRGPLKVLCDKWLSGEPPVNLIDYVNGFRHRLYVAGQLAKQNLGKAQVKMKYFHDQRSGEQQFSEGDQVLALLPIAGSPFQARFAGPYTVVEKLSELNYLIATPDRRKRNQLCHVNLLKPYHVRPLSVGLSGSLISPSTSSPALTACTMAQSVCGGEDVAAPDDPVLLGRLKNSETLQNLEVLLGHLPTDKRAELSELIKSYPTLFRDTPSKTTLIEHDIDVGDAKPIRQRFYRVSEEKSKIMAKEVQYMLENNIAVPSSSSWASPCLLGALRLRGAPAACGTARRGRGGGGFSGWLEQHIINSQNKTK
ncbi:FMS-like tyrosine kinase 1 [Sarotherodon galilaeus]